jgi:hypothetical protein
MKTPRYILGSGAAYFGIVFAAGFVLGSIRVPWLVPCLGVRYAELIEMPFMLVAMTLAAGFVVRRWSLPATAAVRLGVGAVALGLLVATELSLAWVFQGLSPARYVASRDPVSGGVFAAMLVVFALLPLAIGRRHRDS